MLRTIIAILTAAVVPCLASVDWPSVEFIKRGSTPAGSEILTGAAATGDQSGRLLVASKTGKIFIWQNQEFLPAPFLDLGNLVPSHSREGGVTDVCPAPGFSANGTFYVFYTRAQDGHAIIARYQASGSDPNLADPLSGEILLEIARSSDLHVGGDLEFGADGFLYISSGDDERPSSSQDLTDLRGKILRIDVTSPPSPGDKYVIPGDNPYAGNGAGIRPEIWARGLRNPWRIDFDPQTAALVIADVGENDREEINRVPPGGSGLNFGWPLLEGTLERDVPPGFDLSTLTPPWFEYDHSEGNAVIGGITLRGGTDRLNGLYWFADFGTRKVRAIDPSNADPSGVSLGILESPPSGFVRGEDGKLYILSYAGIYEVLDTGAAQPPKLITSAGYPQTGPIEVTLSTITPGANIHYTLDGSPPDGASPSVPSGTGFTIDGISTLRARSYRADLLPSTPGIWGFYFVVGRPTVSPAGFQGIHHSFLTATTATPGAEIRYTTDGSAPVSTSPLLGEAIRFDPVGPLRIMGFKPGYANSEEAVGSTAPSLGNSIVSTLTGNGTSGMADGNLATARFSYPADVVWTPDNRLYIADTGNHRIRCVDLDSGLVTTLAGSAQGLSDGAGSAARFSSPESITYDPVGDFLYVADTGNRRIRRVSRSGAVTTIATTTRDPVDIAWNHDLGKVAWSEWAAMWHLGASNTPVRFAGTGAARVGQFAGSVRMVDDGMGGWFALSGGLRKVAGESGAISTWIGEYVSANSLGTFDGPRSLARVYADSHNGIARDGLGNLYYSVGQSVRKLVGGKWQVTLAGDSYATGFSNGPGTDARFHYPSGLDAGRTGRVFLADKWNHAIRSIDQRDWDGDMIADVDENPTGVLTVGEDDSSIDSDGDGFSDALEFFSGTHPLQAGSQVTLGISADNGSLELDWTGSDALRYLIERSDDLTRWKVDGPPIDGTDGRQTVSKPLETRGFYRLAPMIPASPQD